MTEIIIALIAVPGSLSAVIVALLQRSRKENRKDHSSVLDRLDLVSSEIRKDIRQVRADLTQTRQDLHQHVNDHAIGKF